MVGLFPPTIVTQVAGYQILHLSIHAIAHDKLTVALRATVSLYSTLNVNTEEAYSIKIDFH
ncbi:hypothetical protein KBT16_29165 [Nostoc sp. CCCryo 231-06]|nr:hypothetical protein [Nostoc sp. CCCryo 231-06]